MMNRRSSILPAPRSPVSFDDLFLTPSSSPYGETPRRRFTITPSDIIGLKQRLVQRRPSRGPISRTLSYLRTKMDLALSTSSLYPSREDVRQWETSFESILNNKFGCALFRQFLKKEFSDENMDFWLECEEFKKMKDGKKSTTQKAIEIYTEFVAEHAPKEVNLDSDTRAATRAAVEAGCKPDTFALAQNRVEQLMSKDSYRRFLRDRLFLDLLESYDSGDKDDKPSSSKDRN
ncbi:hypothetical protein GCK72_024115 [Caenorhabditis remanei]|uniref:RGS domain-containing protein n=1 Tax=Caenorhabditis remanei TaxID=31234 RepID=A0A6A5FYA4_CAERE|nr:hypothetical protein GCK72_024115 [Caenorhabditis remanei]KAF1747650.1 hypothetical protein GCK72_024115 [Caenorhabditis remanei]